jgi:hypothetical protein
MLWYYIKAVVLLGAESIDTVGFVAVGGVL